MAPVRPEPAEGRLLDAPRAALLLGALLLLVLLGPALWPGNVLLPYDPRLHPPLSESLEPEAAAALVQDSAALFGDRPLQCLPFDRFTGAMLGQGRLPLWNPYPLGGAHHPAQGTGQVFYPPAWLHALWDPLDLGPFLFAGHLLLGAWFLAAWLARLGLDRRAALASALFWILSGWAWTNLHHPPIFQAGSWLFLGFWSLERLARLPWSPAGVVGAAGATTFSFLAGFPQIAFLAALLLGAYALLLTLLALGERGWRSAGTSLALPAFGALAVGCALAAPQLLAFAEEAGVAGRERVPQELMAAHSLSPVHLLGLFFPELLAPLRGNPYGSLTEMHPTYALLALDRRPAEILGALNAKETWLYLGLLPLLLVLAALPAWRQARAAFFMGCALFGVLAALGLTPFLELWALVGGRVGDPKRILFFTAVGSVILAGLGLDRWLRQERPGTLIPRAALFLALLGAIALAAAALLPDRAILRFWLERVAPLFAAQIAPIAGQRPWWEVLHEGVLRLFPGEPGFNCGLTRMVLARFGLAALAAGIPLWLAFRGPARRRWPLLAAALALALGDLGFTAWRMARPVAREGAELAAPWRALFPEDPGPGGEPGAPGRLLRLESARRTNRPELLVPNLPALLGWEDVQGYVPLIPGRMRDLFAALEPGLDLGGAGVHSLADAEQLQAPFLRLLRPSRLLSDVELGSEDWRLAGATPAGVRLYAARKILTFAFTVPIRESLPRPGLLERLARPGWDPTERVLVEGQSGLHAPPDGLFAPARLLERRPGRIVLEARGPCSLVLCEGFHTGWRAWVDGQQVPVFPANHAFLGLDLDRPGTFRVELRFRPSSHWHGLVVAAAGGGGLALLLLLAARRARRSA